MIHLGFFNTSSTRTHVRFQFSTHAAAGGNVAPSSSIDAADIRVYRANDGAAFSATQRSSANGITCTSPFDSLTGFHDIDIDLTDNTDSGFYAAGYTYSVVLAPNDETIDSQTITGVVLAMFEIGVQPVNVSQFGGTAGTFSSGRPEVNTTLIEGSDATNQITASVPTAAQIRAEMDSNSTKLADILTDTGTTLQGELDGIQADTEDIQSRLPAALTGDGNIKADTLRVGGTLQTAGDLKTLIDAKASQTSVDDIPTNAELATALAAADDAVLSAIAALNNLSQANIRTALGMASANFDTQIGDLPTNSELATALAAADDAVLAAIGALNNLSSAGAQTAVTAALTAALTEGYRGTGATGSVRDLLYEIIAHLGNASNAGTLKTLTKLDKSTTAKTFTYDDDTLPTSVEETT